MPSLPFFLSIGPPLIFAVAGLGLMVVTFGLQRAPYTLAWAAACGVGVLAWGISIAIGRPSLLSDLLSVAAILLTAEGFRMRRFGRVGRPVLAAAGVAAAALVIATNLLASLPIRAAVLPFLGSLTFGSAIAMLVRPQARPSRMEQTTAVVLAGVLLVHAAGMLLALAERFGPPTGQVSPVIRLQTLYLVTAEPVTAAVALAMFMLVASDYAAGLRRMLHVDPLTSVLNREGFAYAAQVACERSRGRRIAIAIADIDHFKQVNDAHGHAAGDATLAGFAACLTRRVGREGVVARIGGEEFAILLPGLDGHGALARIERLRHDLDDMSVENWPELRVSASFGLAERGPNEALDAAIERADAALYRSKREGRNRSTLAEPVA